MAYCFKNYRIKKKINNKLHNSRVYTVYYLYVIIRDHQTKIDGRSRIRMAET